MDRLREGLMAAVRMSLHLSSCNITPFKVDAENPNRLLQALDLVF